MKQMARRMYVVGNWKMHGLSSDLAEIQAIAHGAHARSDVDVALLPIGGHYTMDRRDAVLAAEFVGAATVIPMHYDTFPPIETDAEAFKSEVEEKTSSQVVVLSPGATHEV